MIDILFYILCVYMKIMFYYHIHFCTILSKINKPLSLLLIQKEGFCVIN